VNYLVYYAYTSTFIWIGNKQHIGIEASPKVWCECKKNQKNTLLKTGTAVQFCLSPGPAQAYCHRNSTTQCCTTRSSQAVFVMLRIGYLPSAAHLIDQLVWAIFSEGKQNHLYFRLKYKIFSAKT
jgi:hypothetical protein